MGAYARWTKAVALAVVSVCVLALGMSPRATAAQSSPTTGNLTDHIGALEERAYAAWKARDAKFWAGALSERFVGWGPSGRIGKSAAIPILTGENCRIATVRLTDQQLTPLTSGIVLLTHKTDVDGTCSGKAVPAARTVTLYVRENGQWKIGFRAQSQIVDPMKAVRPAGSDRWASGRTGTDIHTQALLARELAMVDGWKDHDAVRMDKFFGLSLQFVDIFGNHIGSRADALKAWSGEGCDVKDFKFTGARATMFAPDFGILTYRASYDAKCFGQDVWPIWGTAFYVKQGDRWMWSSGINVLAGAALPG
ncbi:MAG: nuclear transport factor 2 family protein [Proteobacteria bacterium]|nr:nuclear transport factor 2 family protein [Pseudomonadota bacterium]